MSSSRHKPNLNTRIKLSEEDKKRVKKARKSLRENKEMLELINIKLDCVNLCVKRVENILEIIDKKYAF
jgi:hypothetical protein